jgi:hypothetical protein
MPGLAARPWLLAQKHRAVEHTALREYYQREPIPSREDDEEIKKFINFRT